MIDLITVVYKDDVPLLKVQAQSINQYVLPADVNSIVVIVNDDASIVNSIDTAWWGQHQNKVKVKPRSFVSDIVGWESQQLCKLLAAADSTVTWSMSLDPKVWFVKQLDMTKLFDNNGKPRSIFSNTAPHFDNARQFVEKLYNIKIPAIIGTNSTPFMFHTATVKELINSIDNFVMWFQTNVQHPNMVTEFYLYAGFILSKYSTYYSLYSNERYYRMAAIGAYDSNKIEILFRPGIMDLTHPEVNVVAIHRNVYASLSDSKKTDILNLMVSLKLIQSPSDFAMPGVAPVVAPPALIPAADKAPDGPLTLTNLAITSTTGVFSCAPAPLPLTYGQAISISGLFSTGGLVNHTSGKTYYIVGNPTSTAFQVSDSPNGAPLASTVSNGTINGITVTIIPKEPVTNP